MGTDADGDRGGPVPPVSPSTRLVVVGASAGGVAALRGLLAALPVDLPCPVLVVLHLPEGGSGALPTVLGRGAALPVGFAADGDALQPGIVVLAPPDRHLLVRDGRLALGDGPREGRFRPAVDALFRSAAASHGPAVVAVVLSGALHDGTAGALAVARRGGTVLVEQEAQIPGMPTSVRTELPGIVTGRVEHLAATVAVLAAADPPAAPTDVASPARTSPVRHAAGSRESREAALWLAWRALQDRVVVSGELAARAEERGNPLSARRFRDQGEETAAAAEVLRRFIIGGEDTTPDRDPAPG